MTLLHHDVAGTGSVHGLPFVDHLLDAPEHLVADILTDPHWRLATDDEVAAHATSLAPAVPKRTRKKTA